MRKYRKGELQEKLKKLIEEEPRFIDELEDLTGTITSSLNITLRRLMFHDRTLVKFRMTGRGTRKAGAGPVIYYYERDRIKAYERMIKRAKTHEYYRSIAEPMLNGLVKHGQCGREVRNMRKELEKCVGKENYDVMFDVFNEFVKQMEKPKNSAEMHWQNDVKRVKNEYF